MSERLDNELRSSKLPNSRPGAWGEMQALRECAIVAYPEPHVRILREIFPALYTFYLEEDLYLERTYRGSITKGQLRAVIQDLRYTARFLAMVARQSVGGDRESDRELGWLADRFAVHIEKLADLIEKRIVPKRKRTVQPDGQAGEES